MDLTTVARVKARNTRLTTSADALLAELITEVSADAEARMARYVEAVERTEVVDIYVGKKLVRLPGAPITAVSEVSRSSTPVFTAEDVQVADTDYYVLADTSHIRLASKPLSDGFLEVTYTGGMAADTASFVTAFPDLTGAVEQEVINRYNAKDLPAGEIHLGSQGAVKRPGYEPLPIFEKTCRRYRLRRIA